MDIRRTGANYGSGSREAARGTAGYSSRPIRQDAGISYYINNYRQSLYSSRAASKIKSVYSSRGNVR